MYTHVYIYIYIYIYIHMYTYIYIYIYVSWHRCCTTVSMPASNPDAAGEGGEPEATWIDLVLIRNAKRS